MSNPLYKSKRPFEIPWYINLQYKIFLNRWAKQFVYLLSMLIAVIASIIAIYYSIMLYESTSRTSPLFRDPGFAGLFGALLGAIIAAGIGGFISYTLQSQQAQAVNLTRKKEEIYIPLYNDLVRLKLRLTEHAHPNFFTSNPNEQLAAITLTLLEWGNIEQDNRWLQIPNWLKNAMNGFIANFEEYQRLKKDAVKPVQDLIIWALLFTGKVGGNSIANISYLNEYMVRELLIGQHTSLAIDLQQLSGHQYSRPEELLPEFQEMAYVLYSEFNKMPTIRCINKHYETAIIQYLEWLIYEMGTLIRYIGAKYELENPDY